MRTKSLLTISMLTLALAAMIGATPIALAQEDSWTLTLNFQNVDFGVGKIYVEPIPL
jgi:hypothetical protein